MQIFIFIMYRYSLASIPLNEHIMRSKSHSSHIHVPTIIGGRPQSYRHWRKESLTEACKAVAEGELSVRGQQSNMIFQGQPYTIMSV